MIFELADQAADLGPQRLARAGQPRTGRLADDYVRRGRLHVARQTRVLGKLRLRFVHAVPAGFYVA